MIPDFCPINFTDNPSELELFVLNDCFNYREIVENFLLEVDHPKADEFYEKIKDSFIAQDVLDAGGSIPEATNVDKLKNLLEDVYEDNDLITELHTNPRSIDGWDIYKSADRGVDLRKNPAKLRTLADILDNQSLQGLGFDKESLKKITEGNKNINLGSSPGQISAAETVRGILDENLFDDLLKLGQNLDNGLYGMWQNFDAGVKNWLEGASLRKLGTLGTIRDMGRNPDRFTGDLHFERPVTNGNGNTAEYDVEIVSDIPSTKIDHKFGPNSINPSNFEREFIKRDIFDSHEPGVGQVPIDFKIFSDIEWRVEGWDRENLKDYIKSRLYDLTIGPDEDFGNLPPWVYEKFDAFSVQLHTDNPTYALERIEDKFELREFLTKSATDTNPAAFDYFFDLIFKTE